MKTLAGTILVMISLASWPAAAGPWRGFGGGMNMQTQQQRPGGYQRQPQPQRQPQYQPQPQRDYRAPDRPRDGRLTDEERRNLHRDLDRANREIYNGRRQ